MGALPGDLRVAIRALKKTPAFTAVAVLTLALGIGATALIYSVIDAVVLRPLPCPFPDRMVLVVESHPERGKMVVRPANYEAWRQAPSLERSGIAFGSEFVLAGQDRHITGALVDAGFFETWGVRPRLGRAFVEADYRNPVASDFFGRRGGAAVLSDGFWKRRFAGDPNVLGRTLTLDGAAFTIVGIMPPSFRVVANYDVFVPWILGPKERAERRFHYFPVVARLKLDVSPLQAQKELAAVYRRLAAEHPEDVDWSAEVIRPRALLLGTTPEVLALLFGAVSLVLAIACANVANLLLARGLARRKEIAVRLALGSTRRRLIVQQLAEGGLLGVLGAIVGLGLAALGIRLVAAVPAISELPFTFAPSIEWRVLAFTSAVTIGSVLLFAVLPAFAQSRVDLIEALKGSPGAHHTPGAHRVRSLLVVCEVALGIVVVVVTMLMTRSLIELQAVSPGIRTDEVLTLRIEAPAYRYADKDLPRLYERILGGVRSLPGVRTAALTGYLPLTDPGRTWRFSIEGRPATGSGDEYFAVPAEVSREFFSALGITKVDGRLFDRTDTAESPAVVVISQTAGRRYWPQARPIGQRIRIAGLDRAFSVIGVVADVHQANLQDDPAPAVYTLLDQTADTSRSMRVIVKTAGDPLTLASAVRSAVRAIDAAIPIDDMQSMEAIRRAALGQPTFRTLMLASFAALALLLGAIGLYGVLSQLTGERRHEIGLRVALGATGGDVATLVALHTGRLVGVGLGVGVLVATAVARLIRALLFHVSPIDVASFAIAGLLFLFVAAVASWLPARRAARVDPMLVLRAE